MFLIKSFTNDPIFQKLFSCHFDCFELEELTQRHIKTFVRIFNNFTFKTFIFKYLIRWTILE